LTERANNKAISSTAITAHTRTGGTAAISFRQ